MATRLYRNLAANATTTLVSGPGTLHSIIINDAGASANVCTVYDNTAGSGTIIATIDTVTTLFPNTLTFECKFGTGLTIVIATGTAANITVVYSPN